ncbi:MAG TPA: PaaI family thioesterase [Solirubrobacteraceae bacterium]|nr:PaaI family thioesterase [Solirubrobacteraceae bacterium]
MSDLSTGSDAADATDASEARGAGGGRSAADGRARSHDGPRSLDGVSSFFGLVWEDPQTVRLRIRPDLINNGGLLSGVATYALVDYCMGSTLWVQTSAEEHIATISIAINYLQTATEGEIVCSTVLDRRNRTIGIMKSEVRHEDGRQLVTATGSYSIFPARKRPRVAREPSADTPPGAG